MGYHRGGEEEEVGEGEEEVRERTGEQWGEEEEERGTVGGQRSGFPCPIKRKWTSGGLTACVNEGGQLGIVQPYKRTSF